MTKSLPQSERKALHMKKTFILICAALLLLTGCVRSDTELVFNADKTIDMTVVYSLERNSGATDEAIESVIKSISEQLEEEEIGFETDVTEQAYTVTVPLRFDDVEEMKSSPYLVVLALIPRFSGEDGFEIDLDDDGNLNLVGVMNASTLGFTAFTEQAGLEPDKLSASFTVKTPDGGSGQWSIKGSEEANVEFSAKNIYGEAKADYSPRIVLAIAVVVVLAAAIILVPKKPKKEETKNENPSD